MTTRAHTGTVNAIVLSALLMVSACTAETGEQAITMATSATSSTVSTTAPIPPVQTAPNADTTTTAAASTSSPLVTVPVETIVLSNSGPAVPQADGAIIFQLDDFGDGINVWGDRQIMVTQTENLRNGDPVGITGSGYLPGTELIGGQCAEVDPTLLDIATDCSTTNFIRTTVGDDGTFQFAINVEQNLQTFNHDCRQLRCVVGAAPVIGDGFLQLDIFDAVGAEISFAE